MVQEIQDRVADNSQRSRRLEANFVEVAERGRIDLTFAQNTIAVEVGVRLYKRDLNGGLVSGHSDPAYGSGRGVSGDVRGGWSLVEDTPVSAELTKDGRKMVRDVLDGQDVEVTEVGNGDDATDAGTGDTALGNERGRSFAWGDPSAGAYNENRVEGEFRFHETGQDAVEFGIFSRDGSLVARLTVGDINPSLSEEVRAEVVLTVEGSGQGEGVVTEDGEQSIAESFTRRVATGLAAIGFGSGTSSFSKTDTALSNEVITKDADRELDLESLSVFTLLYDSEPSGQTPVDLSEIKVEDVDGRMVWATSFSPEEKTDSVRLNASVGFRIV
jgi:hypothetical protein